MEVKILVRFVKIIHSSFSCYSINEEIKLKKAIMPHDELKSKKFMCNVLLTRLARQKRESLRVFNQAEKKVKSDVRLVNILDKVG